MNFVCRVRVVFGLLLMLSSVATGTAAAQSSQNEFDVVILRSCSDYVSISWAQNNAAKIEFTATDTSENWTTGWQEVDDIAAGFHAEPIGRPFDKVNVRVTFADGFVYEDNANVGQCADRSNAMPQEGVVRAPAHTPGGGGPAPQDGSYSDAESGNSFEFLTAHRMCEDNRLITTWAGNNITDVAFMVYNPSPGWGTDWLQADTASGQFSTAVERDTAYFVDAAVTFTDESSVIVKVHVPECTPASDTSNDIPDAGLGESSLRVQLALPGDVNISGASYNLYAPVAAAQTMADPYLSGFVGPNNTVAIDGLIPGQYRLVVYPAGMEPIDFLITVGDDAVTNAVVTVNADGTVTVAYLAQETPAPTVPAGQPAAPAASGVSGLPSTGAGTTSGTSIGAVALMTATSLALLMIPVGIASGIRRRA